MVITILLEVLMDELYRSVSFQEAKELMDTEPELIILDVRDEEEYITGHAEGAVLFPMHTINEATAAEIIPDYDTPLLVYCKSGRRAADASMKLAQLGYTQVYNVGSLVGWPYGLTW
jgi:rhodanese-related sulfurtransferase